MELKELVERAKKQDLIARGALKKRVKEESEKIALKYVNNKEKAAEIVKESFDDAFSHLDSLKDSTKFDSWFYSIVNKTALNKEFTDEDEYDLYDVDDDDFDRIIDTLPLMERRVANMYYREGMSILDIADIFGCKEEVIIGNMNDIRDAFDQDKKEDKKPMDKKVVMIAAGVGATLVVGTILGLRHRKKRS